MREDQSNSSSSGFGACMMNSKWRDEQRPPFINFITSFLSANSFRLNIVPIAPDFIFNCGGLSVAFVFLTSWNSENTSSVFTRVQKLKEQFAHLYVIVPIPSTEQKESFAHSYFKYGIELGKPTFVPVHDLEMGFEKMVKIALACGECRRQDAISKLKAEKERSVEGMHAFVAVVTSLPGIDAHDANALNQAIGSVEAIATSSKEYILQNTDLPGDKAENIKAFFQDPKFYLCPKLN